MTPQISITCIDTLYYTDTITALLRTLDSLIGKAKVPTVYWFSDIEFPSIIPHNVIWIKIEKITHYIEDYSKITLKTIPNLIDTDYNLVIHADGFAVNNEAWTDEFLEYDYIGAQWPWRPYYKVGNGGFSLRSRKLYQALHQLNVKYKFEDLPKEAQSDTDLTVQCGEKLAVPEDNLICRYYRPQLEKEFGIKFAPPTIADRFSIESNFDSPWLGKSFGFHGKLGAADHYGIIL